MKMETSKNQIAGKDIGRPVGVQRNMMRSQGTGKRRR